MAKNYKVIIEETFHGTMTVSAKTADEAKAIATQMYNEGLFQVSHTKPTATQMSVELNAEEMSTCIFESE